MGSASGPSHSAVRSRFGPDSEDDGDLPSCGVGYGQMTRTVKTVDKVSTVGRIINSITVSFHLSDHKGCHTGAGRR